MTLHDLCLTNVKFLFLLRVTLREFAMLQFMNSITDKPKCHIKVLYLKFNIICLFNSLHTRSISKICKAAPYMCVSVCTRSSLLRSNLRFRRASFFPFSFSILGIRSRISEITCRFCLFGSNMSFPPSPSVSCLCGFPLFFEQGNEVLLLLTSSIQMLLVLPFPRLFRMKVLLRSLSRLHQLSQISSFLVFWYDQ